MTGDTCPSCGDYVERNKDGTFRKHGRRGTGRTTLGCPGSGRRSAAKRVRFKAKGVTVSFLAGKKKKPKGKPARLIVYTVHDEGERYVVRWRGKSETEGKAKMREWARRSGRADLMKVAADGTEYLIDEAY